MTHRRIGGDETRTRYTPAPRVTVTARPNNLPALVMEFPCAAWSGTGPGPTTRITFTEVFEYRFIESKLAYFEFNPQDSACALIEIVDSQLKESFLNRGWYRKIAPEGEWLPGVRDDDLHHYRIGFDEHGHYEIVCLGIDIEKLSREWN